MSALATEVRLAAEIARVEGSRCNSSSSSSSRSTSTSSSSHRQTARNLHRQHLHRQTGACTTCATACTSGYGYWLRK